MTDVPGERGQLQAPGHRTDNNSDHPVVITHEASGAWVIHAPGVRLDNDVMIAVAESILRRAR